MLHRNPIAHGIGAALMLGAATSVEAVRLYTKSVNSNSFVLESNTALIADTFDANSGSDPGLRLDCKNNVNGTFSCNTLDRGSSDPQSVAFFDTLYGRGAGDAGNGVITSRGDIESPGDSPGTKHENVAELDKETNPTTVVRALWSDKNRAVQVTGFEITSADLSDMTRATEPDWFTMSSGEFNNNSPHTYAGVGVNYETGADHTSAIKHATTDQFVAVRLDTRNADGLSNGTEIRDVQFDITLEDVSPGFFPIVGGASGTDETYYAEDFFAPDPIDLQTRRVTDLNASSGSKTFQAVHTVNPGNDFNDGNAVGVTATDVLNYGDSIAFQFYEALSQAQGFDGGAGSQRFHDAYYNDLQINLTFGTDVTLTPLIKSDDTETDLGVVETTSATDNIVDFVARAGSTVAGTASFDVGHADTSDAQAVLDFDIGDITGDGDSRFTRTDTDEPVVSGAEYTLHNSIKVWTDENGTPLKRIDDPDNPGTLIDVPLEDDDDEVFVNATGLLVVPDPSNPDTYIPLEVNGEVASVPVDAQFTFQNTGAAAQDATNRELKGTLYEASVAVDASATENATVGYRTDEVDGIGNWDGPSETLTKTLRGLTVSPIASLSFVEGTDTAVGDFTPGGEVFLGNINIDTEDTFEFALHNLFEGGSFAGLADLGLSNIGFTSSDPEFVNALDIDLTNFHLLAGSNDKGQNTHDQGVGIALTVNTNGVAGGNRRIEGTLTFTSDVNRNIDDYAPNLSFTIFAVVTGQGPDPTPTPVPGSLLLLGTGLAGLVARRRMQRNRS